jgi:hypothetical protein
VPLERRAVLALPGVAAMAAFSLETAAPPAMASAGTTAGKTISVPRAKQEYNPRITAAVAAFERLADNLVAPAGSVGELKSFFAKDGPFDELNEAGYELAVAFKMDGKAPPEKVQTVKTHRKLMAELSKLKGVKKPADAAKPIKSSRTAMAAYLEAVQLPPLGDGRYDEVAVKGRVAV